MMHISHEGVKVKLTVPKYHRTCTINIFLCPLISTKLVLLGTQHVVLKSVCRMYPIHWPAYKGVFSLSLTSVQRSVFTLHIKQSMFETLCYHAASLKEIDYRQLLILTVVSVREVTKTYYKLESLTPCTDVKLKF